MYKTPNKRTFDQVMGSADSDSSDELNESDADRSLFKRDQSSDRNLLTENYYSNDFSAKRNLFTDSLLKKGGRRIDQKDVVGDNCSSFADDFGAPASSSYFSE